MNKLLAATAVAAVLAAQAAWAQTAPSAPSTPPAATTPSATPTAPTTGSSTTTKSTTTTTGSSMQPQWYAHSQGEWRASKLIGSTVRNSAGESVGDINEVVVGQDGKMAAVVLGVGGFLGMGEREVAVQFDSLRISRDANGNPSVTINASKDALTGAPAWTWSSR